MNSSNQHSRIAASQGPRFKKEIHSATDMGVSPDDLVLDLTFLDASKLKRDPNVPLEDISFGPDGMRYLGVKVRQGGVPASQLGGIPEAVPAPLITPAPKKMRAKKAVTSSTPLEVAR